MKALTICNPYPELILRLRARRLRGVSRAMGGVYCVGKQNSTSLLTTRKLMGKPNDMKIVLTKLTCKRCSWTWTPRKADVRQCPHCKSAYWRDKKPRAG